MQSPASGDPKAKPSRRPLRYSIIILTWMRDPALRATLSRLESAIGAREDVEVVLVDNNSDGLDRMAFLRGFKAARVVQVGYNKGVFARNDGMALARGEVFVLLDDDVLPQTNDFLDRFGATFDEHPDVGVVNVCKLDAKTLVQRREYIPHSRKSVDTKAPFFTFRFVGGMIALRRAVYVDVGGFSPEFFFGAEERDYSFRIIQAGWKMYYRPDIVVIETNDSGGRRPLVELATETTKNFYIISYLYKPIWAMLLNFVLFSIYSVVYNRGHIDIISSFGGFLAWLRRPGRPRRQPLSPAALGYIRVCGGSVWR